MANLRAKEPKRDQRKDPFIAEAITYQEDSLKNSP